MDEKNDINEYFEKQRAIAQTNFRAHKDFGKYCEELRKIKRSKAMVARKFKKARERGEEITIEAALIPCPKMQPKSRNTGTSRVLETNRKLAAMRRGEIDYL